MIRNLPQLFLCVVGLAFLCAGLVWLKMNNSPTGQSTIEPTGTKIPVWDGAGCGVTAVQNRSLPKVTEGMSLKQARDAYLRYLATTPVDCAAHARFGKKGSGGWNVCLDEAFRPTPPCVIYSFGINNDFSFDDAVSQKFGCVVRAFDPSMHRSDFQRSDKVFFYNVGLGGVNHITRPLWTMRTLGSLRRRFNEQNVVIPYLKFDIESSEWAVLNNMVNEGDLANVKQIALETHVPHRAQARHLAEYYRTIDQLTAVGFKRWHSFRHGGTYGMQHDHVYINVNFCK